MGLIGASTILTNTSLEMNLITVSIAKSAASECDWAGIAEGASYPTSAVGGLSRESVLPPRKEQSGSSPSGQPLQANRGAGPRGQRLFCVLTNGFCFRISSNFGVATNAPTISGPCFSEREEARRLRFFCYKALGGYPSGLRRNQRRLAAGRRR
jgi:hypothetical protein